MIHWNFFATLHSIMLRNFHKTTSVSVVILFLLFQILHLKFSFCHHCFTWKHQHMLICICFWMTLPWSTFVCNLTSLHLLIINIVSGCFKVVLLYGDKQLINCTTAILWQHNSFFSDILPFPGEFHFMMHVCHAVYRLGFTSYLHPVIAQVYN